MAWPRYRDLLTRDRRHQSFIAQQRDVILRLEAELRAERRVTAAYVELAECLKAHVRDQARHLVVLEELADLLRARWAEAESSARTWRKAYRRLEGMMTRLCPVRSVRERKARHLVQ